MNKSMLKQFALCLLAAFLLTSPNPASANKEQKNWVFRQFLYEFFNEPTFQINHIKFPLEHNYINDEYDEVHKSISREEWKHLPGPEHYRCEKSCFDIVIYDNFERKYSNGTKRRLSFEGIGNGIDHSMYFIYENGEWFLIKWEDLSN